MKTVGLTGGIASGKSTAARYLAQRGAHIIDADQLGHRAYEPGTQAHADVVSTFGEVVLARDGQIDRRALGAQVFGQPDRLKALTDIVWPEIRRLAEAERAAIRAEFPQGIIVIEAAVLFEAGWDDAVDEIWVITVAPEVAIERAMARDGVTRDAVRKRIDAQLTNDERRARADVSIDNSTDEAALRAALDAAWLQRIGD